ncbi:unnamed protein product [Cunninghamella echinulata]
MTEGQIGKLHTFKVSHFSEKARWALDYCNVPYVEKCHVPVLHRLTFLMNFFFSVTVPLFVPHQKGYPRTLPESAQIVQYANDNSRNNKKLLPENQDLVKEIHALEKIFDTQFGPAIPRFVYYYIIDNKSIIYKLFSTGMKPGIQTFILNHGFYVIKTIMKIYFALSKKRRDASEKKIDTIFQMVEDRLSDGRRYLVGDSLSTADITFASLAAPLISPEELPIYYEVKDMFPQEGKDIIMKYRESVAGQFALRIYKDHRYEK